VVPVPRLLLVGREADLLAVELDVLGAVGLLEERFVALHRENLNGDHGSPPLAGR